jgi:hypothetical protein
MAIVTWLILLLTAGLVVGRTVGMPLSPPLTRHWQVSVVVVHEASRFVHALLQPQTSIIARSIHERASHRTMYTSGATRPRVRQHAPAHW